MSLPGSKRLLQLFERELRDQTVDEATVAKRSRRVSVDLDRQVVEFAAEVRSTGCTPEQMLVELKQLLSRAAPEIPTSERTALLSTLTGRAIDAFFGDKATKPR